MHVADVSYAYGSHQALQDLSFDVPAGSIFGLLGPNGGGKTTLFRLLTTLMPVQSGQIEIDSLDVRSAPDEVRRRLGVTFQSPSLDRRLTVWENLRYQALMYGLRGSVLKDRITELLELLGISERQDDVVDTLSGGLKRRVEVAKSMLHRPRVLLLDEPSTGLDPNARLTLWSALEKLRTDSGVTVLLTTHLMDEAERCDRLAILDRGRRVAEGTPAQLRAEVGGDCITIQSDQLETTAEELRRRFQVEPQVVGDAIRLELPAGHEFISRLMGEMGDRVTSVSLGRPTLEDVFVRHTGHQFWEASP